MDHRTKLIIGTTTRTLIRYILSALRLKYFEMYIILIFQRRYTVIRIWYLILFPMFKFKLGRHILVNLMVWYNLKKRKVQTIIFF